MMELADLEIVLELLWLPILAPLRSALTLVAVPPEVAAAPPADAERSRLLSTVVVVVFVLPEPVVL